MSLFSRFISLVSFFSDFLDIFLFFLFLPILLLTEMITLCFVKLSFTAKSCMASLTTHVMVSNILNTTLVPLNTVLVNIYFFVSSFMSY